MRVPRPLALSLLVLSAGALSAAEPTIAPLFDIEEHIQQLSEDNFELQVKLGGVVTGGANVTLAIAEGEWLAGEATTPEFNKAAHTCSADGLKVADGGVSGDIVLHIRPDKWVPTDKQPHDVSCTVDLDFDTDTGDPRRWKVTGTVTGKPLNPDGTLGEAYEAPVTGAAVLPVSPGYFNLGRWDDGLALRFDLGEKRVNWNRFKCSRHGYAEPQDWSTYDAVKLTVTTDEPRADVSVTLWAREIDGSWYYCKDVVPLIDATNTGIARFTDFTIAEWVCPAKYTKTSDEDYTLDLKQIQEFAIGVVNPMGVGEVGFTVTAIETVVFPAGSDQPATVRVDGKTLSVNGHEMVPAGMFGGYAPDLPEKYRPGCQREYHTLPHGGPTPPQKGEKFIIEMWGDRTQPATLLKHENWEEKLTNAARDYATRSKANPEQAVLEFWNEPYLDWAKGRNYNRKFFDQSSAEAGGEVRTTGGLVIPHFKWRKNAKGEWQVYDETQFTYWSGLGNGYIYDRMATVVAKTVKDISPETKVIVGWGKKWNEDHWAMWDMLYLPTIEKTIDWIDGCHEHHYQGDTATIPGTYEVLTAYGMAKHDKWLYSYNTETNDLLDIPSRGYVADAEEAKRAQSFKRLSYNMRDCLYAVLETPDKAMARTVIHIDHTPKATDIAYGLMSCLRGRLLRTHSDEQDVWCIASIDGTDPGAPRADDAKKLVVFVWNDHRSERRIAIDLTAPTGTTFAGGEQSVVTLDREDFSFAVASEPIEASGTNYRMTITLPARRASRFVLDLEGEPVDEAEVTRSQHFADDVLKEIRRDAAWTTTIDLDAGDLAGAKRAWLRCVVESVSDGEAVVRLGEQELTIPRAITGSNVCRIRQIPLALEALAANPSVTFAVADGNHAGYRVDMASIVIER